MNLDHLRLTFGLAHSIRGAELRMECEGGHAFTASNNEGADVGLCVMRQVVMAGRRPGEANHVAPIRRVRFVADVVELGDGIVFDGGTGCHFFASYLAPAGVRFLGDQVVPEGVAYDVAVDLGLEVSLIRFAAAASSPERPIYRIAQRLHEECLLMELEASLDQVEGVGAQGGGR